MLLGFMRDDIPTIDWDRWLGACATSSDGLQRLLDSEPQLAGGLLTTAAAPSDGEPYGRRPLYRGPSGEVLLVRWREDTFCAPHDHGAAEGLVALLRGRFVERRWRWGASGLAPTGERTVEAPAIVSARKRDIHSMKATGGGVGLHFYRPAITGMRVYDCARRETLIVGDDCGAWVPADPALVIERIAW